MHAPSQAYTPPDPVELLQQLIRFDTTNPPGNEAECIQFIHQTLAQAGIEAQLYCLAASRPNLVARLPGEGKAPPLLLYGHVDVVTTAGQPWSVPPFEGRIQDGFIWGRVALDMKGGVAMLLSGFLRLVSMGQRPPGDVIFCAVADEENSAAFGARYLVENQAHLFSGVKYALSEFGGFSLEIGGKRFYPIMVGEKQLCKLKFTVRGPGGHGSMPVRGGAMRRMGELLRQMDRRRLPVRVTPPVRAMFEGMAAGLPAPMSWVFSSLLRPALTDRLLDMLGEDARPFDPLLHNTACPTRLQASEKDNVIPSQVTLVADGRLLPGLKPEDMLADLRPVIGPGVEVEVLGYEPGPPQADMGLFHSLAAILKQADPQGLPSPYVMSGVSDARFFARLGIQTYGFTPMKLPASFKFAPLIHAADERIPVEALEFGSQAVYQALMANHA